MTAFDGGKPDAVSVAAYAAESVRKDAWEVASDPRAIALDTETPRDERKRTRSEYGDFDESSTA